MGLREWFLRQLDRGEPALIDLEEPVELADVNVHEGPLLIRALNQAGIEAHGFEGVDVTTKSSTRYRVVVRRRDLPLAREVEASRSR